MTTEEKIAFLKNLPSETISPKIMALVDGGDPYSYNLTAREGKLDLPHFWRGRNLRIWKSFVIDNLAGKQKDRQRGNADGEGKGT